MFIQPSNVSKRSFPLFAIMFLSLLLNTFLSCNTDKKSGEEPKKNDFKAEWPTFKLTREQLEDFFNPNGSLKGTKKKLIFAISIDDFNEPCRSMSLFVSPADNQTEYARGMNPQSLDTDTPIATPVAGLIQGNTEIFLETLSRKLFKNGTWITGFEYIRLTPRKHKTFRNFLSFEYAACDKDGKTLPWAVVMANDDDFCNPTPPGRPSAE